jgi:hypothetical protein
MLKVLNKKIFSLETKDEEHSYRILVGGEQKSRSLRFLT